MGIRLTWPLKFYRTQSKHCHGNSFWITMKIKWRCRSWPPRRIILLLEMEENTEWKWWTISLFKLNWKCRFSQKNWLSIGVFLLLFRKNRLGLYSHGFFGTFYFSFKGEILYLIKNKKNDVKVATFWSTVRSGRSSRRLFSVSSSKLGWRFEERKYEFREKSNLFATL